MEPIRSGQRQAGVRRMTLVLLVLTLGISGCSAYFGGWPGSDGTAVSRPRGAGDKPVGGDGGVVPPLPDTSRHEEADPTVVDAHAAAVDHFVIGPDGRTVVVYWWGGNRHCFGLLRVDVELQRGTPVITVLEGTRHAARDQACTMEAVLKSALVTLDEPILADAANPDADPGAPELPDQPLTVTPMTGVLDARPHALTGFSLSADGMTLSAYYVGGTEHCYALASATVDRDGDGPLTVAVHEGRRPDADAACEDIGIYKVVELQLDEPVITVATSGS